MSVTLSIILGTYNRLHQLKRSVAAARASVGPLSYEFVICDGGSTDGSVEWLTAQQDVVLVQEQTRRGAVAAYNQAYARASGEFLALINDDCGVVGTALAQAVAMLQAEKAIGQVALPFDRLGRRRLAHHKGQIVASYGVTRAEAAKAVAAECGGIWNPIYHTYGGDWELSLMLTKLGWWVVELPGPAAVIDYGHETKGDELRTANTPLRFKNEALFYQRWGRR